MADVLDLAAEARAAGEEAGVADAAFLDLVLRAEYALRTTQGLDDIEIAVRRAIADAPYFAQGWRARILLALGRVEEARTIWRALAPHLDDMPKGVHEWLVASAGHAELAIALGDSQPAAQIMDELRPYGHLHIASPAMTPYGGPVALVLSRLAVLPGSSPRRGRTARSRKTCSCRSDTVEQHVSSALRKLGLPNRAALATWVTGRQR